jgi:hypothetical protein
MAKKKDIEPRDLHEIVENKWPVRFNRKPYDEWTLLAFVLDVNDEITLVNAIDEDAGATGFDVFLNKTVKSFLVYDDPEYCESLVVKLKRIRPKKHPGISIDSISDVLRTVNALFPLLIIYREKVDPGACWVGKVTDIKKKTFVMQEISPDGDWDNEPTTYKFKEITKVSFANGYENNLALVADYRAKEKP